MVIINRGPKCNPKLAINIQNLFSTNFYKLAIDIQNLCSTNFYNYNTFNLFDIKLYPVYTIMYNNFTNQLE